MKQITNYSWQMISFCGNNCRPHEHFSSSSARLGMNFSNQKYWWLECPLNRSARNDPILLVWALDRDFLSVEAGTHHHKPGDALLLAPGDLLVVVSLLGRHPSLLSVSGSDHQGKVWRSGSARLHWTDVSAQALGWWRWFGRGWSWIGPRRKWWGSCSWWRSSCSSDN